MTTSRMKKCSVDGFFNGALCGSLLAGEYLECGLPDGVSCCYQQTVLRPVEIAVPTPIPVPVKVKRKILEKDNENYLHKKMTKLGGECYKWQSINQRGVTDRICVFPLGDLPPMANFWLVELKRDKTCSLSPGQERFHKRMAVLGIRNICTLHTMAEIDAWLTERGY